MISKLLRKRRHCLTMCVKKIKMCSCDLATAVQLPLERTAERADNTSLTTGRILRGLYKKKQSRESLRIAETHIL